MKVLKTTDYSIFKRYKENRDVVSSHVGNLASSIKSKNLLRYMPIITDSEMRVVDGQHRLAVAKKLKEPVYYQIVPDAVKADIILLNANVRAWRTADYVKYYAEQGYPDYIQIREFSEKYGFSPSLSLSVLSGTRPKGGLLKTFKKGDFKISDLPKAREIAEFVLSVRGFCDAGCWRHMEFIYAIYQLEEKIPLSVFCNKLQESKAVITPTNNITHYLRQFEFVLNHKRKKGENYLKILA